MVVVGGFEFEWDRENTKHLAAHKVTPAEFEQALNNDPLDLDYEAIDGEERYRFVGLTNGGRFLRVGVDSPQRKGPRRHRVPGKCLEQEGLLGETPMRNRQTERIVPAFATEAEEADWWYKNRHVHDKQLLAAVRTGEAKILTKDELRRRIEASKKTTAPVVALRIPAADLALARKQAEQKELPYQTHTKSLLHETLAKRERQKVG
ncbi:MAG: hypothetical protein ABSG65_33990 [Bryobacteraceae bacterium]|jgi:hypothetical protein